MPEVTLYEHAPTRSAKCRWALLETGVLYESVGNSFSVIGSDALKQIHPLGKLPAAVIDGKPLFESSAIVTAIADLAPERNLIARAGSWERNLHNQWVSFALSELEAWAWTGALNSRRLLLKEEQQVPEICPQMDLLFKRGAAALEAVLDNCSFLIEDRFTVTDIIVGYAVNLGRRCGYLNDEFRNCQDYLKRLFAREHCTLNPD